MSDFKSCLVQCRDAGFLAQLIAFDPTPVYLIKNLTILNKRWNTVLTTSSVSGTYSTARVLMNEAVGSIASRIISKIGINIDQFTKIMYSNKLVITGSFALMLMDGCVYRGSDIDMYSPNIKRDSVDKLKAIGLVKPIPGGGSNMNDDLSYKGMLRMTIDTDVAELSRSIIRCIHTRSGKTPATYSKGNDKLMYPPHMYYISILGAMMDIDIIGRRPDKFDFTICTNTLTYGDGPTTGAAHVRRGWNYRISDFNACTGRQLRYTRRYLSRITALVNSAAVSNGPHDIKTSDDRRVMLDALLMRDRGRVAKYVSRGYRAVDDVFRLVSNDTLINALPRDDCYWPVSHIGPNTDVSDPDITNVRRSRADSDEPDEIDDILRDIGVEIANDRNANTLG